MGLQAGPSLYPHLTENLEGVPCVLIEREEAYIETIKRRLK
jgi:hypothetical protein